MVLHIVRAVFLLVVLALTISAVTGYLESKQKAAEEEVGRGGAVATTGDRPADLDTQTILAVLIPVVVAVLVMIADVVWKEKNLQALSGLFFGLLAGLALAYVLGLVVDLVAGLNSAWAGSPFVTLAKLLVGAMTVFLCVSFIMQTKDDFRFVIPYVEFSKQTKGARPLVLDTSVIIDGRIADIADTRVLESQLIIPRFVLAELQAIADSADKLKRNRGRRGLDMLNRLQTSDRIDLVIMDARVREVDEAPDVDNKLVALARHLGGRVITNDYNLSKVAQLRSVDVININDLANALKPVVLPGEAMIVKVIKPGEEVGQGVGYLEDGTMVVAEGGRDHIGEEVSITVTSVLQTSAGRMIFGRLEGMPAPARGRGRR